MKLLKTTFQIKTFALVLFSLLSISLTVTAEETTIIIRAQAKDAKFIGSSMGGALVIVKEHHTEQILSKGYTQGGTGDTDRIMKQPHTRDHQLSDENAAGFKAIVDIERPTFVTIEVYAPFSKKQATALSSTQLWLIPGKDILGDGIILEVPGFVVDILSPQTHESIDGKLNQVSIRANVVLLCGCPVTVKGMWDAEQYEIAAIIYKDGKKYKTVPLGIQGKASTFGATLELEEGSYEIEVFAFDPQSGNSGLDKVNFSVNG